MILLEQQLLFEDFYRQYKKIIDVILKNSGIKEFNTLLKFIASVDPTYDIDKPDYVGTYAVWILKNIKQSNTNSVSSFLITKYYLSKYSVEYTMTSLLEQFQFIVNNKTNPKFNFQNLNTNIVSYKTIEDLAYMVFENIKDLDLDELQNKKQGQTIREKEKSELLQKIKDEVKDYGNYANIYSGDKFQVYTPFTEEQQIVLSQNTKWCTQSTTSNSGFSSYNEFPLFIFINKSNEKIKFQLGINNGGSTTEFKNSLDEDESDLKFLQNNIDLWKLFIDIQNNKNTILSNLDYTNKSKLTSNRQAIKYDFTIIKEKIKKLLLYFYYYKVVQPEELDRNREQLKSINPEFYDILFNKHTQNELNLLLTSNGDKELINCISEDLSEQDLQQLLFDGYNSQYRVVSYIQQNKDKIKNDLALQEMLISRSPSVVLFSVIYKLIKIIDPKIFLDVLKQQSEILEWNHQTGNKSNAAITLLRGITNNYREIFPVLIVPKVQEYLILELHTPEILTNLYMKKAIKVPNSIVVKWMEKYPNDIEDIQTIIDRSQFLQNQLIVLQSYRL